MKKPKLVLIQCNIDVLHAQLWRATFGPIEELRALVERLAPCGKLFLVTDDESSGTGDAKKEG